MDCEWTLPKYALKTMWMHLVGILILTQKNKTSHHEPAGNDMPSGRLMRRVTAATETATWWAKPQLSSSHGCYTQSLTLYKLHSIHPSIHSSFASALAKSSKPRLQGSTCLSVDLLHSCEEQRNSIPRIHKVSLTGQRFVSYHWHMDTTGEAVIDRTGCTD